MRNYFWRGQMFSMGSKSYVEDNLGMRIGDGGRQQTRESDNNETGCNYARIIRLCDWSQSTATTGPVACHDWTTRNTPVSVVYSHLRRTVV